MAAPHSGFLIQSQAGGVGNFEMVAPTPFGGLVHRWRDNDNPAFPWSGPLFFGSGDIAAASLIQSSFGNPGHLEVVAVAGDKLVHYWRDSEPPFPWYGPFNLGAGVAGRPALIEGRFGGVGNFEVVVPLATSGMAHYSRDNDMPGLPWSSPTIVGDSLGKVDAVALIQSSLGTPGLGHLELVALAGGQLSLFWREDEAPFTWHGPLPVPLVGLPVGSTPVGGPALIQGAFGGVGNFELLVPLSGGGLAHLARDNDTPGLPWSPITLVGSGPVSAVALTQSNLGGSGPGNLEALVQVGTQIVHYWREDGPPFAWHGPTTIVHQEIIGNPAIDGEWRIPYSTPAVGVHAALLHTGRVLFWSYESTDPHHHHGSGHDDDDHDHDHDHDDGDDHQERPEVCIFDPETGEGPENKPEKNLFCAGQTIMADGRVLVAGGTINGVQALHTFAPAGAGGAWQDVSPMSGGDRWYPTCTALPDGRVMILSGSKEGGGPTISAYTCQLEKPVNATYELFDPTTNASAPAAPAPMFAGPNLYNLYPFVYVLPDGRLLVHFDRFTFFFDLASEQWQDVKLTTLSQHARTYPAQGTSVLLPLLPGASPAYAARVMIIGGAGLSCPQLSSADTPADASCEILDLSQPLPQWQAAAPMLGARVMPDAVLLPDGTVLVMNGSSTGVADNGLNPVLATDLYDPATDSWTPMRPMRVQRLYHSTALLLPDGRVLTAGKDRDNNPAPFKWAEYRAELFSPPYLFKGPRPNITGAPATVAHGASFVVNTPDAAAVASAAFVRPGAVTHSFNHSQRHVGLTIAGRTPSSVTLAAPPSAAVAPPGPYMLFLLSGEGVPSVAEFVQLG